MFFSKEILQTVMRKGRMTMNLINNRTESIQLTICSVIQMKRKKELCEQKKKRDGENLKKLKIVFHKK